MGTYVFLALLVCLHVVAGSSSSKNQGSSAKNQARSWSCPDDPDIPVEVLAREVETDEEVIGIMGCDTVSVDKGKELAKSK